MATENLRNDVLEISGISADWDWRARYAALGLPSFPQLTSIKFVPGAASDEMLIKEESDSGPELFHALSETTHDSRIEYYHGSRGTPYIDYSECTLSGGHRIIIKLWRGKDN